VKNIDTWINMFTSGILAILGRSKLLGLSARP